MPPERRYFATTTEVDELIEMLAQTLKKKAELESSIRENPKGLRMVALWGEFARQVAHLEELLERIMRRTGP